MRPSVIATAQSVITLSEGSTGMHQPAVMSVSHEFICIPVPFGAPVGRQKSRDYILETALCHRPFDVGKIRWKVSYNGRRCGIITTLIQYGEFKNFPRISPGFNCLWLRVSNPDPVKRVSKYA